MSSPAASRLVPGPKSAGLARFLNPAAVLAAALAAGALAHAVLLRLAAGQDEETLARALPGPLAGVVQRFAGAPLVPSLFVVLVPLLVWVACGALTSALRADDRDAQRAQALIWLGSIGASLAALASGMTAAKQGMAALGYALAWPALASVAAVLWASPLPRIVMVALVTDLVLLGLAVRALPIGWPGENSLSWWAMLPHAPRGPMLAALLAAAVAAALAVIALRRDLRLPLAVRLALLTLVPALLLRTLPGLEHYGPEKHAAALASEINTSYFQVAGRVGDRGAFVRGYAADMGTLPMHTRTHPPTWPLLFRAALDAGARPQGERLARFAAHALGAGWDASDSLAASVAERPLAAPDVAGLWLVVAVLAACVLALPLATYFAARAFAPGGVALLAAAWAALLPAPLLYFPDVDVAHPVAYVLVLGAWLRRDRHALWALAAGTLAAALVALSFGNLTVLLVCAAVTLLGWNAEPARRRRELVHGALLLLPLALLVVGAERAGARPFALYAEAMRQHHLILAHRTRVLWIGLNLLESALALGVPTVLWLAGTIDWRALGAGARRAALSGGEGLLAGTLLALLVLDGSGQTKAESGRLWMGCFPLVLAGAAPALAGRERDWPRLAVLLAVSLVVLKGFYVYVWLYTLK
jgi:hypothetical protein